MDKKKHMFFFFLSKSQMEFHQNIILSYNTQQYRYEMHFHYMVAKGVFTNVNNRKKPLSFDTKIMVELHDP